MSDKLERRWANKAAEDLLNSKEFSGEVFSRGELHAAILIAMHRALGQAGVVARTYKQRFDSETNKGIQNAILELDFCRYKVEG